MICHERDGVAIHCGDVRDILPRLPDASAHCVVTSPPYWGLRDYGVDGQIGLEDTPEAYVDGLVLVFREIRRVLRDDGSVWVNLGDSYASGDRKQWRSGASSKEGHRVLDGANHLPATPNGLKPKDLIGIPWRVAFALQADGWYLRQDIIWHKPNPMPESVTDRCTKAHEYIFLLSKQSKYYYDAEAVRESNSPGSVERFGLTEDGQTAVWNTSNNKRDGRQDGTKSNEGFRDHVPVGRNKRSVWSVLPKPYKGAHFATFPPDLIRPCILAGCPEGGTVLDPFLGSGTTAAVAQRFGRKCVGIELSAEYCDLAIRRFRQRVLFA